jgi:hypothetical protein
MIPGGLSIGPAGKTAGRPNTLTEGRLRQLLENPGCSERYLNRGFLQKDLLQIGQCLALKVLQAKGEEGFFSCKGDLPCTFSAKTYTVSFLPETS